MTQTNYPTNIGTQTIPIFDNLPIHQKSFILNDSEIKATPTTGITVIPALGSDKIILPVYGFMFLNWFADYSNINAAATFGFKYNGTNTTPLSSLLETANGQVSNLLVDGASHGVSLPLQLIVDGGGTFVSGFGQYVDEPSGSLNTPLVLKATNPTDGDFEDGDSSNSLQGIVVFLIFNKTENIFI